MTTFRAPRPLTAEALTLLTIKAVPDGALNDDGSKVSCGCCTATTDLMVHIGTLKLSSGKYRMMQFECLNCGALSTEGPDGSDTAWAVWTEAERAEFAEFVQDYFAAEAQRRNAPGASSSTPSTTTAAG